MSETVETLNFLVGTGGILLLAMAAALFADIVFFSRRNFSPYIERYGLLAAAGLTVGAMFMALLYSEQFGFVPCGLCWTMRIFVFSQAFIMVTAWLRRDTTVAVYGIVLAIPGIIVGLYQHFLQFSGSDYLPCPASGGDCGKRILFEYGFMTFPLVGASMLLVLLAVYIYLLKSRSQ
ncbi:disulfide bond formation protein B [Candidatus Pacebacteria bacterium]|nr:disulfide bond formation protein B [Candidatus Paceibacterota bacterium]